MKNTATIGKEREREMLGYIRQTQRNAEAQGVRDPDRHLDTHGPGDIKGQLRVEGKAFDFAWEPERVLLELDGGQWVKGGGRHNSDADKWKTLEAQALGWRVLHISYTMLTANPWGVMRCLAEVLEAGREGR